MNAHLIYLLNTKLYTHVKLSPTKTIYVKYYTVKQKQTNKQTNKTQKQKHNEFKHL